MPETGDLGSLGGPIRDGALLAAIQVNDADLNVTVNTRVEDTQTDPQAGIRARMRSSTPATAPSSDRLPRT